MTKIQTIGSKWQGYFWIGTVAVIIGFPIILWATNFCFSRWRYVSKNEICESALAALPTEVRTSRDRCDVSDQGPDVLGSVAYSVEFVLLSYNVPKNYAGDWFRRFDRCGTALKVH
jgi:hypothetical protein